MVLKCADIGHLAASLHTHKRWALQLEEEFFRQVCACFKLGMGLLQVLLYVRLTQQLFVIVVLVLVMLAC
jgi:hypothetical protein